MWPFNTLCGSTARLEGKTVIITGANSGIGKETARDLYRRGARVILACRNIEKANAAAEDIKRNPFLKVDKQEDNTGDLAIYQLDLSSFESVRECAKSLLAKEPVIHILINNAGIAMYPFEKTVDGNEMQLQTNHLGHFLLTLLLLPRLQLSGFGCRIINVSSCMHWLGNINFDDINLERSYGPWKAYTQSKLANVLFTKELVRQLAKAKITGINVYALHPGLMPTEISRYSGDTFFYGADKCYTFWTWLFFKNVVQGAQTTIYCAIDEKAGEETGLYYSLINVYALHPGLMPTEISRHSGDTFFYGADKCYTFWTWLFFKNVVQGAQTTIYCAIDEKAGEETGLYYSDCSPAMTPSRAMNADYSKKLWDISCRLLHLEPEENLVALLNTISRQIAD